MKFYSVINGTVLLFLLTLNLPTLTLKIAGGFEIDAEKVSGNEEYGTLHLTTVLGKDPQTTHSICFCQAWGPWQGVPYFFTLKVGTLLHTDLTTSTNKLSKKSARHLLLLCKLIAA